MGPKNLWFSTSIFLCSTEESHTGLYEGEYMFIFWVDYPFNIIKIFTFTITRVFSISQKYQCIPEKNVTTTTPPVCYILCTTAFVH